MHFRVNLKMKKSTLCYWFTSIVYLLNLIWQLYTFLLVKWGMGDFKKWGQTRTDLVFYVLIVKIILNSNFLQYIYFLLSMAFLSVFSFFERVLNGVFLLIISKSFSWKVSNISFTVLCLDVQPFQLP